MKQERERSVRTVAETRFNYERLTRELARILPAGVWVGHLAVAPGEPEQSVVDAGADSAVGAQPLAPAMTISGCAPSQDVVADTLDRLRALTTATEVEARLFEAGDRGRRRPELVDERPALPRERRRAARVATARAGRGSRSTRRSP